MLVRDGTYSEQCGVMTVVGPEDKGIGGRSWIPGLDDSLDVLVLSQLAF
jgi:hypothetical protein